MAARNIRSLNERRDEQLKEIEMRGKLQKYYEALEHADLRARASVSPRCELLTSRFFILSLQTWVNSHESCIPCELSLVELTMRDGVSSAFNQLIFPVNMPNGVKGRAKIVSEKYHKIWLDNGELSHNYPGIVSGLVNLLRARSGERPAGVGVEVEDELLKKDVEHLIEFPNDDSRRLLPILVMPDIRNRAQKALKWLCNIAKMDVSFTLYSLPKLLYNLVLEANESCNSNITNEMIAEVVLEKTSYLQTPRILCNFHWSEEVSFCAGDDAMRKAAIFLDNCHDLFDTDVSEGT